MGECGDPSKIIYSRYGNRMNEPPKVHLRYTCSNHARLAAIGSSL